MEQLGFVKDKILGRQVIVIDVVSAMEEEGSQGFSLSSTTFGDYLDGGFVEVFLVVDKSTVVMMPLVGQFRPTQPCPLHLIHHCLW